MDKKEQTKPLREWNDLAKQNAENAIVSSMFVATLKTTSSLDTLNNWLLVTTGAIASFLLANINNISEFLGRDAIVDGGYVLCISCVFGVFGKIMGMRCKMAQDLSESVKITFLEHMKTHEEEEAKIQEGAKFWGISLDTGVRIERILSEYLALFPAPIRWLANRHFKKEKDNPQIAYVGQMKSLQVQGIAILIQATLFIYFFVAMFTAISKL
ncbi:hypothetical protein BOO29_19360 [Vibrio navarrensis]|uniref:hypothetical protein n=1 Tax=Vibrio TaxID=662 RepID=UPI00186A5EED|nr:hypothetical protein [Vibrio navarrensis]MBE4583205.1 hypothetical protein [Vibrio navarrensis]MBE4587041.1 hypothetical protein [Vibrio navarrensis]